MLTARPLWHRKALTQPIPHVLQTLYGSQIHRNKSIQVHIQKTRHCGDGEMFLCNQYRGPPVTPNPLPHGAGSPFPQCASHPLQKPQGLDPETGSSPNLCTLLGKPRPQHPGRARGSPAGSTGSSAAISVVVRRVACWGARGALFCSHRHSHSWADAVLQGGAGASSVEKAPSTRVATGSPGVIRLGLWSPVSGSAFSQGRGPLLPHVN